MKNFVTFTGKRMCQSLSFNIVEGYPGKHFVMVPCEFCDIYFLMQLKVFQEIIL